MIARKKVVPPVTPKIIRTSPRQRLIQYGLLFFAFVLSIWLSYEAGQHQAPADGKILTTAPQASKQRMTELEQERDSLKQQVAELEQSVEQVSQALTTERIRNKTPGQVMASPRKTPPAPPPVASAAASAELTLGLEGIRIEQTDSENIFRVVFSVINEANNTDRVTGTIWIAVNGFLDKEPRRLSFRKLSSDKRSYVKMGFNRKQDVTEEIVLPDGFRPKNILIEAKPYGEKYTGTAEKISWATN